MTQSNTPPGHYHIHQTLSHWKTDRKQIEDRRKMTEAKPCHALSSSQTTAHAIGGVNHGPIPKLGSRSCCRLRLSWLPVNCSSEGDTQSCCIVIVLENIYKPAVLAMYCIESTGPTSRNIIESHTPPLGPNHGWCCRCWNWRCFSVAMWTSAWQTKRNIVVSLLNTTAHNMLYSGRCSRSRVCVGVGVGIGVEIGDASP